MPLPPWDLIEVGRHPPQHQRALSALEATLIVA